VIEMIRTQVNIITFLCKYLAIDNYAETVLSVLALFSKGYLVFLQCFNFTFFIIIQNYFVIYFFALSFFVLTVFSTFLFAFYVF